MDTQAQRTSQVNVHILVINIHTTARFLQHKHDPLLVFPAYRLVTQTTPTLCAGFGVQKAPSRRGKGSGVVGTRQSCDPFPPASAAT